MLILKRFSQLSSIRHKLIAFVMATSGAVLIMASLAFIVNEALMFRKQMHQELTTLAGVIGTNTTAALTFGDQKSAARTLEGLATRPYVQSAYILTKDGAVFAKYVTPEALGRSTMQLWERVAPSDRCAALSLILRDSQQWWRDWDGDMEIAEQILLDNDPIGMVIIQSDVSEIFSRLKWFFVMVALILIATLAVAYFLSNRLQRPISDPILRLAETMKTVSEQKNYTIRISKQSDDEIGQLFDGFNDMLGQIQKRDFELERYAAEMRESNEELKAFLYSAAHDLREPLVNIKGFTGELGYAVKEISNIVTEIVPTLAGNNRTRLLAAFLKDVPEALGFIESGVDRMDSLINSLLKLSRVGHQLLRFETVHMEELIREILHSLTPRIREKNIEIRTTVLPDVNADREAMKQIFINLIDNALKFIVSGRQPVVEISGEKSGAETIFRVRDNGRGISKEDMPKLFKMFRRVGAQDLPGEGVGLAFIKTLVRRHSGRIWCESEPGSGTTFSFTIPG